MRLLPPLPQGGTLAIDNSKAAVPLVLNRLPPRGLSPLCLAVLYRILRPSGVFIWMSVGTPDLRLEAVEDTDPESDGFLSWDVAVHAVRE